MKIEKVEKNATRTRIERLYNGYGLDLTVIKNYKCPPTEKKRLYKKSYDLGLSIIIIKRGMATTILNMINELILYNGITNSIIFDGGINDVYNISKFELCEKFKTPLSTEGVLSALKEFSHCVNRDNNLGYKPEEPEKIIRFLGFEGELFTFTPTKPGIEKRKFSMDVEYCVINTKLLKVIVDFANFIIDEYEDEGYKVSMHQRNAVKYMEVMLSKYGF